jgi:small subunit ribosomal protein S1
MDKGVVVDIGNDIEGFVPISQLNLGKPVTNPADDVYEGMILDMRVLEVDPIHRRIVLAVTNVPEEQPPRPETPSKVIPMDAEEGAHTAAHSGEEEVTRTAEENADSAPPPPTAEGESDQPSAE